MYEPHLKACHPALGQVSKDMYGAQSEFLPTRICKPKGTGFCNDYFIQNFDSGLNATAASKKIRALQEAHWIDLQTRQLEVLVTYYNAAADMF